MHNIQTIRAVISGVSGSGKTTYLRKKILRFRQKVSQTVIINYKPDLHALASGKFDIGNDAPITDIRQALDNHRTSFFLVDGNKPEPFLNKLGYLILQRKNVLVVVDEAYRFMPRGRAPERMMHLITKGRSNGIHVICATQMLKASNGMALDLAVLEQASHLISFQLSGSSNIERFTEYIPELGQQVSYLNVPDDGGIPEYVVKHKRGAHHEVKLYTRSPRSNKSYVEIDISNPKQRLNIQALRKQEKAIL